MKPLVGIAAAIILLTASACATSEQPVELPPRPADPAIGMPVGPAQGNGTPIGGTTYSRAPAPGDAYPGVVAPGYPGATAPAYPGAAAPYPGTATPMPGPNGGGYRPGAQALPQPGMASADGQCNAAAAQFLAGRIANVDASEQAKQATGAEDVRVLYPGQPITQDFIPTRLNIETDNQNRITSLRCG